MLKFQVRIFTWSTRPPKRLLGHFGADPRQNDAQKGLQNRLSRVPAYFSTREFGRCVCIYAPAKPASASQEVAVLQLVEASAEHKMGASEVLNCLAWGRSKETSLTGYPS